MSEHRLAPFACVFVLLLGVSSCEGASDRVRPDPAGPSKTGATSAPSSGVSVAFAASSIPNAVPLGGPTKSGSDWSVVVAENGDISVDGKTISRTDLETAARSELAKDPSVRVKIFADGQARHGQVVAVLDTLKLAGITKIAFATSPLDATAP